MPRLVAAAGAFLLGAALLSGCDPNPQVTNTGNGTAAITSSVTPAPVTTTSTTEATTTTTVAPPPTTTVVPPPAVITHAAAAPPQTACGADQYRNVDGVCVNRPVAAPGPPPGATAKCNDGTYSFSQHRSGTCSGHHGVAVWL
ncbi:DUF3761 domain-containing protein [Kutzneria buriramensis]|uniref:Uncharacterized protein DUF3761 n=1 Tax=Kutzneria buriramensis TaxID=1045776 RepID=A0A3E0GZN7_9PSEU|nr:DUF3761 domain-containing protein [Kutzneria buriramensis]REH35805.1 uncharacterized protein DUF3761 [Kutzneria buriramensis]